MPYLLLWPLQVLNAQLLLDGIKAYNAAVEVAELLPATDGARSLQTLRSMPQLLKCTWDQQQPTVEVPAASPEEPLDAHTGPLPAEKLGLRILFADASAQPSAPNLGSDLSGGAPAGMPAPALAVVEDRGMAISREQFRTELRQSAGGSGLGVGVAVSIDQAPEYERAGVQLGAPAKPKAKKPAFKFKVTVEGGPAQPSGVSAARDVEMEDAAAAHDPPPGTNAPAPRPAAQSALPSLPQRGTAFISVEGLSSKPGRGKGAGGATAQSTEAGLGGHAMGASGQGCASAGGVAVGGKSWEDWLAPLGAVTKPAGSDALATGKKKKRRR